MAISPTRVTGMATGMDTDNTIKQMLKPYQMRVDKFKQDRQLIQWRQDLYREILGDFNNFKSTYFDTLKPETNMLSPRNYTNLKVESSNSKIATATAGTGALSGLYKITVDELAEAAKITSGSLKGSIKADIGTDSSKWDGKNINITIGNTQVKLENIDGTTEDTLDKLATYINNNLGALTGKLSAKVDGSKLVFESKIDEQIKIESNIDGLGNQMINHPPRTTKLSDLGISASEITLKTSSTYKVQVNENMTLQELTDKIFKESKGEVVARYSELTGLFSLETKNTGSETKLEISGTNNVLDSLKISTLSDTGTNSKTRITPPGGQEVTVINSNNSFVIDDITYTITSKGDTELNLVKDSQQTFDKIMDFVNKYNEIIDKVNAKIEQKKQYTYKPLTDEEKKDMKEEDIKKWEDKAKEGLLRNDPALENMMNSMRRAFFDKIEGEGLTLSDIGLTTSRDTTQRGKIILDPEFKNGKKGEERLKDAIRDKGELLTNLFIKTSDIKYNPDLSREDREARYNNEGIFHRINDILLDYTRTTPRDKEGKKGTLIEKAGIKGDLSEIKNMLTEDMGKKDKLIKEMERKLYQRENKLYAQFAQLEKAMNQMNAQSSWLMQQLGGGK